MTIETGIGASVLRLEDRRFLTGRGHYVSDRAVPGALHCRFVRSDHAHAQICWRSRRKRHAAVPGVAAVLTGADMAEDGVGSMPCLWKVPTKDGTPMAEPPRWALARGRVRHVGEPVAAVLAESQAAADDAAELVGVRYAPLPAVVGSRAAVGAETVLHGEAPGNVCYVWGRGDEAAVGRAMEAAARTVEIDIYNNRIAGAALEPRAAIASYDSVAGTVTLYDTTQAVHLVRRSVAAQLGMADREIRVISPDVGGGFGYKGKHYPEEIVVCWAARRLGRPVRWVGTRGEAFVTDTQARDHRTRAKLALGRGRPLPRAPGRDRGRSGGLPVDLRRGDPERDLLRAAGRGLRHAGGLCRGHGRLHQHGADRRLSRRRAARGVLHPGAAGRPRGRRGRDRCGRDPPPQPGAGGRDALHDADRADLRLRRFPRDPGARAGERGP